MMSCDNYDYIEIVCMFKYPVDIALKSGETLSGKAIDIAKNDQREECIELCKDNASVLVVLDSIATLSVTIENPHFNEVSFD